MPITYNYDEKINLVSTKITGVLSSKDILEHVNSLTTDKEIKPGFIELADFNDIEDLILKYTDMLSIAGMANNMIEVHRLTIFSAYNEFSQAILGMMMPLFHSVELNVIVCKSEKEVDDNLDIFLFRDV